MRRKAKEYWEPQSFTFEVPLYKVQVIVVINMSGAAVLKQWGKKIQQTAVEEFKKCCLEWDDPTNVANGSMYRVAGGFMVFLEFEKHKFRKSVSLLVHELTHVTHYLLRDRRIDLTEGSEEAHTYLVEYLVHESLDRLY